MAELAYNNAKNSDIGYTPCELNSNYHFYFFFDKNTNPCSWSKIADK